MKIRFSGRSTDYISPSFGQGCLYDCTYCTAKRHRPDTLTIATNVGDILTAIHRHAYFEAIFDDRLQKPNQTDPTNITYDISCNEDFILHAKYHNWQQIFQFAVDNPGIKFSLATKRVNNKLLDFNPQQNVRIRFSLMPQRIADQLEPNTSGILDRIKAIDRFQAAGYEVHINFSPVVVYQGWEADYVELFELCNKHITNKANVKCEVIFLTHNEAKHQFNLEAGKTGEHLLWVPSLQEPKTSTLTGAPNVRYRWQLKSRLIERFKAIHKAHINWCEIRYIF